jgi:hypothetical protein
LKNTSYKSTRRPKSRRNLRAVHYKNITTEKTANPNLMLD